MQIKRFNEVNINLPELERPSKDGEKKGQKFVDRLKGEQDFIISIPNKKEKQVDFVNADDVVDKITTNDDKYDTSKSKSFFMKSGNYVNVLQDEEGETYKIKDIKKDAFFGSSKGSSLGLDETREVESIQCLFFALKQYLKNLPKITTSNIEDFFDNDGNIDQEILSCVKIPILFDAETLRAKLKGDRENWLPTFINTANALYDGRLQLVDPGRENALSKDKTYHFHQIGCNDSALIDAINIGYKNPETEKIPISKWSPADVWAVEVTEESSIIQDLRNCVSIKELNEIVNLKFREVNLIGISLKKVGGEETIKIVINKLTEPPNYKFDRCVTSVNPLGSMGVKLEAKVSGKYSISEKETMYLRSYSGSNKVSSISGEVDGTHSKYGKIGLGWINLILSESGIQEDELIPSGRQIQKDASLTDDVLKGEINEMSRMIPLPDKIRVSGKTITGRGSLVSKYQALRFATLMHRLEESGDMYIDDDPEIPQIRKVDKITQDMFYYALSIKNYLFESPMYVRIISQKAAK
jgi:hypothetical protein